jgi:small conductance mechanosensitive channel
MEELEGFLGYSQHELIDLALSVGVNILIAAVILFGGFKLSGILSRGIERVLRKREVDLGLTTFLRSFISALIKILTIITVFTQLGVEMTSLIALLGAAGLAIGMAFSGTLGNLAGGIMILIFKPFKVDDFVETQGIMGVVKEIQIFHSVLLTMDNKTIIIPNGPLANGNIINYTKQELRRVDFLFSISYGEDYQLAKRILNEIIESDERILKEPEHFIGLRDMADSSVDITVRVWTHRDHYWPVFFYMNEMVYQRFTETEGLSIPFPQMDVHVNPA